MSKGENQTLFTLEIPLGANCESASNLDPTLVGHQTIEAEVEMLISWMCDRRPTVTPRRLAEATTGGRVARSTRSPGWATPTYDQAGRGAPSEPPALSRGGLPRGPIPFAYGLVAAGRGALAASLDMSDA
jgi:hypothetical protein